MPFNPYAIQGGDTVLPIFLRGRNRHSGAERLTGAGEPCRGPAPSLPRRPGSHALRLGPGTKREWKDMAEAHGSTRPLLACRPFYHAQHRPHRRPWPSSHRASLRTASFVEDTEWGARHNAQGVGRHGSCPSSVTQS